MPPGDEQILSRRTLFPSRLKCHPDFRDVKLLKDLRLRPNEILHYLVNLWPSMLSEFSSTPTCVTANLVVQYLKPQKLISKRHRGTQTKKIL